MLNLFFYVSATTSAVDVGQTKDLTFNVTKAEGGTALKTIAISEAGTGFSSPTSIICPEGWNIIPSMPPIVNGYVCNDPSGVGLDSTNITLKGMVASASAGTKDFSVSAINTDSTENGGPKTENVKTQIVVKNLTAIAIISPITTNTNQERTYTLNLINNSSNPGDDIAQINGTLTGFNITACSATNWTTCVPSENSFILSGGFLAPENSVDISITAVAPTVSGPQNVSAQITGALGGIANATIDQNIIQIQTPANLTINNLNSDKNYISKNNGAINSAIVSLDITNSGQSIANDLIKTLAIKNISDVDISNQFVITETTASITEILGNGTTTLSWIITADASTSIEALVKAEVSIGYKDINTGVVAVASPAVKVNNQIFTVDNTAPTIASHVDEIIEATGPSGAIIGYIAPNVTDNFDSSVTISSCIPASNSTFSIGSTTITCASSDKAGNVATPASFVVSVVDTTSPIITINGDSTINIEYGATYTDSGATVSDIVDQSVSIIASGIVDTLALGAYEITYDAIDAFGNNAIQVVRTVNVIKKPITITADAKSKLYGDVDSALTYTFNPALITGDNFLGALSRIVGENVGNYAIDQNTLTAGDNYLITFIGANLEITAKPITVTATVDTKNYDQTITSVEIPAITGGLVNSDVAVFTQTFDDKNVGINKTLIPAGSVNDGNEGKNYEIIFVNNTNGVINPIAITGNIIADSRVYNGTTITNINTHTLAGVINGDDVAYIGGTANFDNANIGTDKTVSATGLTLSGTDAGNYTVNDTATTSANITAKPITVIADAKSKLYGDVDPALTYTNSPELIGTDVFTGTTSRAFGENVGSYAIGQNSLTAGDNYLITFIGANLEINPGVATQANIVSNYTTAELASTTVDLIITVKDSGGNLIADGTNIALNTSLGEIIGTSTTKNGVINRILNSNIVGVANLSIVGLEVSGNKVINFVDTIKPVITNITPTSGSSIANIIPTISAQFVETGSGMNKSKTAIFVDGIDVTEFTTIANANILYTSPFELHVGFHNVTINIFDNAGNSATRTWQFAITNPVVVVAPLSAIQWPVDNTIGVDLNAHPYIQFSKLMDESTLIAGNIEMRLYDAQTTAVNSTLTISTINDATRVTFVPNSNLMSNIKYFFYISAGVKDLVGDGLSTTWTTANKTSHEFTSRALYTSWNISLNQGWNLISFPLIPNNNAISTVLASISSKVVIAKYYDASTNSWLSYVPEVGGALTTMEDGKGYWINMNSAGTLNIVGTEMPIVGELPPIYSVVGNKWNLIGFKSATNMIVNDYISGYTNKTSYNNGIVWNYKNGQYLSTNNMEPGYGYWLFVK